ncbi:MAG TPA: sugar-binding protein, partial [Thermoanaerobaculia bacterium]
MLDWKPLAALSWAFLALGDPLPAEEERPPYRVERATSEIRIDGALDEPAWSAAAVVELLYETRPAENQPPPVETRVLLAYDDSNLYVAFDARDPDPSAIRAHLSDRDTAWSDDFVGIVLDPFNDERRAFEFFINPLGVQMDMFNDDVGGNEDESWDAIWSSAGRITETGFIVEVAIPWSSLRFPRTAGEQTWGFDALRFYPRDHRRRIASQPMDRNVTCYLCQISKMTGFAGITPGKNVEVVPTVTSSRTDRREGFQSGQLEDGSVDTDLGITARWGITPNLALNAAINPDFSQVEADAAQLDVNTRFALFFPEKRPFFLEGADFFRTPFDAVFTRNVADPSWGVKLTGKEGRNALGLFVAEDEQTNLILPGSQGSDAVVLPFQTTGAVLRYRRDLGSSSALGVLLTSREGDGYSNRVGGIDGL